MMMTRGRSGAVLATNDKGRIRTGETATTILAGQSLIATVANAIESALTLSSTALLFQIVRPKHAPAAGLNDDRTLSRSEKMRHIRRNEYEAASGIRLELRLVEPLSNPQVPRTFDNGDDFIVRMRMCEDSRTARDSHPVDPISPFARIAAKVRSLSAVGVVGGSEPSNVLRS
jgi:hypothetical protein